ncbi:MAG TPA: hypothetical protein VM328_04335, partial [Fimbriimonadaceae bacterium]|nr:hypothetical protein [Fimbriimonadaceae bacterium]
MPEFSWGKFLQNVDDLNLPDLPEGPDPIDAAAERLVPSNIKKQYKLGEILLANRLITQEQLEQGLKAAVEAGIPLGEALVSLDFVKESLMVKALAAQKNVSAWHLDTDPPTQEALAKVPANICRANLVLPVKVHGGRLILAMRNPEDMGAIELVRNITG